jgi:ubiquinone/menaquinone biosynthesis C-methylase UbiE
MAARVIDGGYHHTRFRQDAHREVLWSTLCAAYFQRLIEPEFHVLELGAGYANFINNIRCRTRTAVDTWPSLLQHVQNGVTARVGCATDLEFLPDASVDFVFASNLFEHLTQAQFAEVLAQLARKARSGATLNILQPNYRRAYKEYFDDYTHVTVYSDVSLCDFLEAHGWQVIECVSGFLPFSLKTGLPVQPWLIRLYLRLPWKPLAKQMFVRARLAPTT